MRMLSAFWKSLTGIMLLVGILTLPQDVSNLPKSIEKPWSFMMDNREFLLAVYATVVTTCLFWLDFQQAHKRRLWEKFLFRYRFWGVTVSFAHPVWISGSMDDLELVAIEAVAKNKGLIYILDPDAELRYQGA